MLVTAVLTTMPEVHLAPLIGALLHLLITDQGPLPLRELEDWWWQNDRNVWRGMPDADAAELRSWSDRDLHRALHEMDDMMVWRRSGQDLLPTAFGHDVALLTSVLVEQGALDY